MSVKASTTTVYKGGGRRWLTLDTAVKSEAKAIIKRKHPTEPFDSETGGGFYWRELPRSDVLLRRMCRLVMAEFKQQEQS
jgi:hypothetical protein